MSDGRVAPFRSEPLCPECAAAEPDAYGQGNGQHVRARQACLSGAALLASHVQDRRCRDSGPLRDGAEIRGSAAILETIGRRRAAGSGDVYPV